MFLRCAAGQDQDRRWGVQILPGVGPQFLPDEFGQPDGKRWAMRTSHRTLPLLSASCPAAPTVPAKVGGGGGTAKAARCRLSPSAAGLPCHIMGAPCRALPQYHANSVRWSCCLIPRTAARRRCARPIVCRLTFEYHSLMRLSPCRFNLPLTDNDGQPIDPQVIVDLHHELLTHFGGFTVHPTSEGRWQSREGRVYQDQVVVYEVAVPSEGIDLLRAIVIRFGRRLGQLAMYFDAPPPSVEVIDLSGRPTEGPAGGSPENESRKGKKPRRRSRKDRPPG